MPALWEEVLGVDHGQAARMLKALAMAGVLRRISTGSMRKVPGTDRRMSSEWLDVAED